MSKSPQENMNQLLQTIGQVSLFGRCDASSIQSLESEKQEKERKRKLELERRSEEMKKAEDERKRQEEEDYNFAMQEQARWNRKESSPKGYIGGRGSMVKEILQLGPSRPKGRGRLPVTELQNTRSFNHMTEVLVAKDIDQFVGEEHPYSNRRQVLYWQGENAFDSYQNIYPDSEATVESASNCHTTTTSAEAGLSSPHFETADPHADNFVPTSETQNELTCGSDQDVKNANSLTSVKPDATPLESPSSSCPASPIQKKTCNVLGIRKVKPRTVNFFTKKIETASQSASQETCIQSNYDFFEEEIPHGRFVSVSPVGESFSHSDRAMDVASIRPVDFVSRYEKLSGNDDDNFVLNINEFPPL